MSAPFARLLRDQTGTTTIEFTIVMVLFFLLTFGLVEFGYLLLQWNSASKAAQLAARLAAVSDPVWCELREKDNSGNWKVSDPGTPGGPWTTNYNVTCNGSNDSCGGSPPAGVATTYSTTNMDRLVYGRGGDTTCGDIGTDGDAGICDVFWRVAPENVRVNYQNTFLGFAGRPGGPVPTVTVTLTGLTFEFIALGGLAGLDNVTMPDFTVTMTGEDLSALAPGAALPDCP
jgi:Flp pilus assembly pilin Flp